MKFNFTTQFLHLLLFLVSYGICAQETVDILPGEYWWGGQINEATSMPFDSDYSGDLNESTNGQTQSLLLSNKGRYIWSDAPFTFQMSSIKISLKGSGAFNVGQSGETIQDAFNFAAKKFYSFNGQAPDDAIFKGPRYNTENIFLLDYTQQDLLAFAQTVLDQGFPAGVIQIADSWQRDNGDWTFDEGKFEDPKAMIQSLHKMGFEIILTVNPFISPDSENFRMLNKLENALFKDPLDPDEPKIVKWWNGYSALLDFTNRNAEIWFTEQLKGLQKKYGVDGFSFEGGQFENYDDVISTEAISANEHSAKYLEIGKEFGIADYSVAWQSGGLPQVQVLTNVDFDWSGLTKVIPGVTLQGIMGYPYSSGSMIGGSQGMSGQPSDSLDQELVVRSAQLHALLPMMQFSVAPWNILDEKHLNACKSAAKLHGDFGEYIVRLKNKSATSGTPIVQSMEYAYPNQGQEFNTEQFMLGPNLLVAPILKKGQRSRDVWLPEGIWLSSEGKAFKGPTTVSIDAPLNVLPYFRKGQTQEGSN